MNPNHEHTQIYWQNVLETRAEMRHERSDDCESQGKSHEIAYDMLLEFKESLETEYKKDLINLIQLRIGI